MTTASPRYYLGLCAIARNETPFLREWVAHHYRIGFEKIYIYDNESLVPVREGVAEFYNLEVCDTYTLKGEAMQNIAYNLCFRDHGHEFEWLALFDLDEFLCLKYDTDARVMLRDYEDYGGLVLHLDTFTSSGHITRPEGLVTLNFTESLGYSSISKCIVRPSKVRMTMTSHHFILQDGCFAVNTNKEPALEAYAPIASDRAWLNHYTFRSQQDYAEKLEKGDATYGAANPRRWEFFYQQALAPVKKRADILPLALEVRAMLESGRFAQRYPVSLADMQELQLPQVLAYMSKLLRLKQDGLAEVVFALCYKRFSFETEFVRFGITLCLKQKKVERARELAENWLATAPDKAAYLALLECCLAAGQVEEALRIGGYLLNTGELLHDPALKGDVERLARQYAVNIVRVSKEG